MCLVVATEELVHEYSFVDEINPEIAATKSVVAVLQLVWRTNDRANPVFEKGILQQSEFVRGR